MNKVFDTEQEIAAQPDIWNAWARTLPATALKIREWIEKRRPDEIWLCGAGTSAFIGDSIAMSLDRRCSDIPVRSIPTTDLVAQPKNFFRKGLKPLVISFGRSGNSSESVGTLNLMDTLAPDADRLNITCNKDSALANRKAVGSGELQVIILPEDCHDSGFAMTSSYTTMLLTAMACLDNSPLEGLTSRVEALAKNARSILSHDLDLSRPERAVFLGSGAFTGTARESALKVLELTVGHVVTSWDSTLGFRHGPKAVVDNQTAIYIFLSSDPLTRRYDQDVATEIREQFPTIPVTTIGQPLQGSDTPDIGFETGLEDVWNTPIAVLIAQRLSVAWSKSLDLNVDDPFAGQNLTRVVSNVRLYS
ncbi:SIS domain-containing protein [Lentilitoribacter sp. Alg239-R112]|uniref:SIS domain-containing protein n=1 Tax=Lentilitoribacter sp. Alg239-R112 TaxID=2305987 RepID=UPI0013A68A8B|nr:SIS domain-containing protein [Lentilitoribacter sp. Alg239-R112]